MGGGEVESSEDSSEDSIIGEEGGGGAVRWACTQRRTERRWGVREGGFLTLLDRDRESLEGHLVRGGKRTMEQA